MNKTKYFFLSLLAVLSLAACSTDGDLITAGGVPAVELSSSGDVVPDRNNTSGLALTFYWTDNSRLTTSDGRVQTPVNATANTLQFSATEDFSSPIEVLTDAGTTSLQYTAESLNALAGRLDLAGDVASTLYIRMKSVLADNLTPAYSNVCRLQVTPYRIDMSRASILASDRTDTGKTLCSPESNGIYSGFMGVAGWYNWWLQEGNGILWGNDDGGKAFAASSGEQHWNFWFPGPSGCYYTVVNTLRQEWSALYIPSLSVSGDIRGEMTYDRQNNRWTLSFRAASAGPTVIRISGTGRQYDVSTGTDDGAAAGTAVAFGMENGKITFGSIPKDITVNVPSAGEMVLSLDLSDPSGWTCTAGKGSTSEEVPGKLYILGNDVHGISYTVRRGSSLLCRGGQFQFLMGLLLLEGLSGLDGNQPGSRHGGEETHHERPEHSPARQRTVCRMRLARMDELLVPDGRGCHGSRVCRLQRQLGTGRHEGCRGPSGCVHRNRCRDGWHAVGRTDTPQRFLDALLRHAG